MFICADNDFASSIEEVNKGMLNISEPKTLDVVNNCVHFYSDIYSQKYSICTIDFIFRNCTITVC